MPINFQTSLEMDLVYSRWWGDVTIGACRQTWATYLDDVYYKPGRTELHDLTDVTSFDANFSSIWSALNLVNGQSVGSPVRTRTLMVVPDDFLYGFARIYQTLAENADGIIVEIYRSLQDAVAALDLGVSSLDDLLAKGRFMPHARARSVG